MPTNGFFDFPHGYGPRAPVPSMTLIADVTATRTTAVNVYNCFSNNYDNYRLFGSLTYWSTVGYFMTLRYIDNNGVYSAANYDWALPYADRTNVMGSCSMAQTYQRVGYPYSSAGIANFMFDIANPANEFRTTLNGKMLAMGTGSTEFNEEFKVGHVRTTNKFTGFQFSSDQSVIMTVRLSIYGYRNP